MITVVDPAPSARGPQAMVVFQLSSMTKTRLYPPGASPATEATYDVSSTSDAKRVTLRRGSPGDGPVVATVDYTGTAARLKGRFGTVEFAGKEGQMKIEEWMRITKGDKKRNQEIALNIGGADHVWTVHIRDGAHGICELSRGETVVATYSPSRSSAPEGYQTRDEFTDMDRTVVHDKTITRANIEFLEATPMDDAFRDEVVFSLLVFQHLLRVMNPSNAGNFWYGLSQACVVQ